VALCMFGCISIIVEGSCVRSCKGLRLCTVGIVSYSAGGECSREGSCVDRLGKDRRGV
jgi:hypothetical protein